jgi:hypothetical protein
LNPGNRDILITYRIVSQTIRYRRVPTYTASDLGYFFTVGSILTNGYRTYPTANQTRRIKTGLNPLDPGHPLERAVEALRRAWINTGRANRGRVPVLTPRINNTRPQSNSPTRKLHRVSSTERTPIDRTPLVHENTLPPLPPFPALLPLIPIPPPLPPLTPYDRLLQILTPGRITQITIQIARERNQAARRIQQGLRNALQRQRERNVIRARLALRQQTLNARQQAREQIIRGFIQDQRRRRRVTANDGIFNLNNLFNPPPLPPPPPPPPPPPQPPPSPPI